MQSKQYKIQKLKEIRDAVARRQSLYGTDNTRELLIINTSIRKLEGKA